MSRLMRLPSGLLIPASSFLRRARPVLIWDARTATYVAKGSGSLTLSGNEITDVIRAAAAEGDGRAVDDSMGIWETTTNLITNGGFETNITGWVESGATITRDAGESKFGDASGEFVTANAAANEGGYHAFAGAAATAYAVSAWVSGSGTVRVALYDNVSGKQASSAVTLTATPQRITVLATTGGGSVTFRVYVETDSQQDITFNVGGVQVEAQPIATPYVETDGATASRSAARVQGPASLLDETQGWVAFRVRMGWLNTTPPDTQPILFDWKDGGTKFIGVAYERYGANWTVSRYDTSGTEASVADTFSAGDEVTVIARWESGKVGLSVDGAAFSDTAGTQYIPTLARALFDVGRQTTGAGSNYIDADVLWFACGKGTLADKDAAYMHNLWQENAPSTLRRLLEAA